MSNLLKSTKVCDGVTFHSIIDKRFKTNRISINLVTLMKEDTVTVNALIPQLLKKGYVGCDNYTALNRKLEELYGAYIEADVQKRGDYQVLALAITGIDDRFALSGESIIALAADILCKMTLQPIVEDGGFSKQYVELEKVALIDTIEAELNEKRIYAINNTIKIMCKDEPFGIPKYGFKDEVSKITPKSAKEQYDRIVKTSSIEIMFTGCGDENIALKVFADAFASLERDVQTLPEITVHKLSPNLNEKVEIISVSQSKMVLGFATNVSSSDILAPAMRLMVAILGGTPSSKLFLNVREKLSLCYYCAARYDNTKGIIVIDCGVEKENIQKAKDEILAQLDLMKQGEFTSDEINSALLSLKNMYSSVYENDSTIESFYLGQLLSGLKSSPDTEKLKLESVTRQEIIAAASNVTLDTVYILTGNEVQ